MCVRSPHPSNSRIARITCNSEGSLTQELADRALAAGWVGNAVIVVMLLTAGANELLTETLVSPSTMRASFLLIFVFVRQLGSEL